MIDRFGIGVAEITQQRSRNRDAPIRRSERAAEHAVARGAWKDDVVQRCEGLGGMNRARPLEEEGVDATRDMNQIRLETALECAQPLHDFLHRFQIALRQRSAKLKAMNFDAVEVHQIRKIQQLMRGRHRELMTHPLERGQELAADYLDTADVGKKNVRDVENSHANCRSRSSSIARGIAARSVPSSSR